MDFDEFAEQEPKPSLAERERMRAALDGKQGVGYVPIHTIARLGTTVDALKGEAQAAGLRVIQLRHSETFVTSGALVAWNYDVVRASIRSHRQAVKTSGWPTLAAGFVRRLMLEEDPAEPRLQEMIAALRARRK